MNPKIWHLTAHETNLLAALDKVYRFSMNSACVTKGSRINTKGQLLMHRLEHVQNASHHRLSGRSEYICNLCLWIHEEMWMVLSKQRTFALFQTKTLDEQ